MIDFEILGDLLRKAKIKNEICLDETPTIRVIGESTAVDFKFDRVGDLKSIVVKVKTVGDNV